MENEVRLIDANELLEKHTCDVYGAYDDSCMLKAVFVPYIKGAPTVDAVEVVHGRWIHDQVEGCNPFVDSLPIWVDVMQCSVCNEYIEGSHGSNYCPNCGAKMDGGNEDG
jgi:hypothetical protein